MLDLEEELGKNDSTLSQERLPASRPKSEQVFVTESLLEETPITDQTLDRSIGSIKEPKERPSRTTFTMSEQSVDYGQNKDVQYIVEMAKLQEKALLLWCFKYF